MLLLRSRISQRLQPRVVLLRRIIEALRNEGDCVIKLTDCSNKSRIPATASFSRLLAAWRSAEPAAFARAWLARAHPIGTTLTVHSGPHDTVSGCFAGIEPDGALRLDIGGQIQLIRAGDVNLT